MPSLIAVVLNDLTAPLFGFLSTHNRDPWQVIFAGEDDTCIRQESFRVQRLYPEKGGIFRAIGDINGQPADLVFFTAPGAASRLHLR